ncbi:MAG TPA: dihydrolipoamide acetyltransferase family protein [Ignavibacteria bacterium]|jgi:2-oxoglutarate dehydrogenase E2 component (dihydrolipoamide succinyltransferase)
MVVDIVMPKMGESIMDGRILKWYKKPGEKIDKDETLFEISTDKVDTEVPSAEGGVVVELLFNEGDTANVGDVVARIETDAASAKVKTDGTGAKKEVKKEEKPAEMKEGLQFEEQKAEQKTIPAAETKAAEPEKTGNGSGFYSPLVLNIASKEGVSMNELSSIKGTGTGGRVRKQDVLAYVEERKTKPAEKPAAKPEQKQPAQVTQKKQPEYKASEIQPSAELTSLYNMPGVQVVPMDNLQAKMAEHMVRSVHTSPHVAAIAECDMSAVDKARNAMADEFLRREGFKLTYMSFICEATVKALKDFPLVNASIDGTNILVKNFINLGIAVAMEQGGLIVPVIKDADTKNLVSIARELNDLARRARIKKLTLDEIQEGTFTITNYGIFGNDIGTPIINQPQLCIMGTGAIKKRAVVVETEQGDAIVIKPMMYITLSFDHRLIDGALGGKFLMRVIEYVENYKG